MASQTLKEFLKDNLVSGRPLAVEFGPRIEEQEAYTESGMRAHILDYGVEHGDVLKVKVSYELFEEFNQAFEKANYFDKNGNPTLTARQAGQYQVTETLYMSPDEPVDGYLTPIEPELGLLQEWQASGSKESYVSFLENRIKALSAEAEPASPRGPKPRM